MLKEGDKAPDFNAKDQDGKDVKLADFAGKRVVHLSATAFGGGVTWGGTVIRF